MAESWIVADIGGTHARFGIAGSSGQKVSRVKELLTRDFQTFEAALGAYLGGLDAGAPRAIAVGAAGPIAHGQIKLTNAPWHFDPPALAARFGLTEVVLANDLVAYAAGIAGAPGTALVPIAATAQTPRDVLVVALGTGLGAARFIRRKSGAEIFPTEAGHMSFAPESEDEDELLERLRKVHPRPSFEHIISGSGLPGTYAALGGRAAPGDGAGVVALAAKEDAAAAQALEFAAGSLATFARSLILAAGGADALVIGGGLGRALEGHWQGPKFLNRLCRAPAMPIDLGGLGIFLVGAGGLPLTGIADLARGIVTCEQLVRFPEALS